MRADAVRLILFSVLWLALCLSALPQKNATFDETVHIAAGYTYLARGDFRLNPEHPPLVKLLSGAMTALVRPRVDWSDPDWRQARQLAFGKKFLFAWNEPEPITSLARVPVVVLGLLLGLTVWHCARSLYGRRSGDVALLLYLLCPDLLAHSQLVTTDLAVAGSLFAAVYALLRALRRACVWRVAQLGLAVSLALLAKFSGVLVFPMMALSGVAYALSREPIRWVLPGAAPRSLSTRTSRLACLAAIMLASAGCGLLGIRAGYGLRQETSPEPHGGAAIEAPALPLLPDAYGEGFALALDSLRGRPAFLLGERSTTGWWYYFLVTFLIKTPIPFLLLLGISLGSLRRLGAGWASEASLLLPVALYWAVTLASGLYIGHRHLLPIAPLLIVSTAKLGRLLDSEPPRRLAVACGALLVWSAVEIARVHPHHLAYFNQIAGGPAGGYRWLVDSNLDWGQDLGALARFRRGHAGEPLYLSYFGTASPTSYGLDGWLLPGYVLGRELRARVVPLDRVPSGALVAVSATNLWCLYLPEDAFPGVEAFMARLRATEPLARIGYSIHVYRVP